MKLVVRRKVLRFGLGAGVLLLLGCDVTEQESAAEPASAGWVVNPPSFAVGSGATFNLVATLPASVARGGTFGVSNAGAKLPNGMGLTPAGILSAGTATVGSVTGVVFTYSSP